MKGDISRPLCIQRQPLSRVLAECHVGTPLSHPFLGAQTTPPKPDVPIRTQFLSHTPLFPLNALNSQPQAWMVQSPSDKRKEGLGRGVLGGGSLQKGLWIVVSASLVPANPLPSHSRPLPEGSAQSWLRQMVFADDSALASAGQSSVQLAA